MDTKPKLAVWKFSSCDGCQLSLLDLEDELLAIAEIIEIANFMEATRRVQPPPYTVSLVEGSVTTPDELAKIKLVRAQSEFLITIGACATSGGIQALKNFADPDDYVKAVYAHPEYIQTLDTATAIAEHVQVDYELHGCPVNKRQLFEVLVAFLNGRRPNVADHSVCTECKARGIGCLMVVHKTPCLGPVTHAGCNALCPAYNRGCYGCFGPKENANTNSLIDIWRNIGIDDEAIHRSLQTFNCNAEPFRMAAEKLRDSADK